MSDRNKPLPTLANYNIAEVLGSGAFSTVYKVMHKTTKQVYACKVMPKSNLTDESDTDRFQREIDTMAFLRHENLVALYDFIQDSENFYLIMDLCSGGELFDYIIRNDKLPEPTAALLFQQIVSAVAYCHSYGVAHRDLKPENILFDRFPAIKVADFGLCGFIEDSKMMKTFCGSPCYCAPECLCRIQYDGRLADIWSLGVILYAMVTGEHPWNISNTSIMLRQIISGAYTIPKYVSKDCRDLISRLMKVDKTQRITMEQILAHPFLKLAANASAVKKMNLVISAPVLPPLQPISVKNLHEELRIQNASGREPTVQAQPHQSQIISPFTESPSMDDLSHLPGLRIRSASVENLLGGSGIKRKKFIKPGASNLSQFKQSSCTNLLEKKKVGQISQFQVKMAVIEEE